MASTQSSEAGPFHLVTPRIFSESLPGQTLEAARQRDDTSSASIAAICFVLRQLPWERFIQIHVDSAPDLLQVRCYCPAEDFRVSNYRPPVPSVFFLSLSSCRYQARGVPWVRAKGRRDG